MLKAFILSLGLLLSSASLAEEVALTPKGCATVAYALEGAAAARDGKVLLETQVTEVLALEGVPTVVKSLLLSELNKIYTVYASLEPSRIGLQFFTLCYEVEGNIQKLMKPGIET